MTLALQRQCQTTLLEVVGCQPSGSVVVQDATGHNEIHVGGHVEMEATNAW
jgi:hypothetical protein